MKSSNAIANKKFILQKIQTYAGRELDPNSDQQVKICLRDKFNIHLPQRRSMNESLTATVSDHEILRLILRYRADD